LYRSIRADGASCPIVAIGSGAELLSAGIKDTRDRCPGAHLNRATGAPSVASTSEKTCDARGVNRWARAERDTRPVIELAEKDADLHALPGRDEFRHAFGVMLFGPRQVDHGRGEHGPRNSVIGVPAKVAQ